VARGAGIKAAGGIFERLSNIPERNFCSTAVVV